MIVFGYLGLIRDSLKGLLSIVEGTYVGWRFAGGSLGERDPLRVRWGRRE